MRVSAVGWVCRKLSEVTEEARRSAIAQAHCKEVPGPRAHARAASTRSPTTAGATAWPAVLRPVNTVPQRVTCAE